MLRTFQVRYLGGLGAMLKTFDQWIWRISHTVYLEEKSQGQPPGMVLRPCKYMGYLPYQLVQDF